jgi:calcium/calmodulin-dependent protein kinase I
MMSSKTPTAIPKIIDFGLAKIISKSETTTEPFGNIGYAAPEILMSKPYSFPCDLWSFGCVLYAMITQYLPFDDDDKKEATRMTIED